MRIDVDAEFLSSCARAEAAARGSLARYENAVQMRVGDGLDELDAEVDAAEALGFADDLRDALEAVLGELPTLELDPPVASIRVRDARAEMPAFRRDDSRATLTLPAGTSGELGGIVTQLLERLAEDPAKTAVTVAIGLGGTGGCATGECLPEDAPPGPLFGR